MRRAESSCCSDFGGSYRESRGKDRVRIPFEQVQWVMEAQLGIAHCSFLLILTLDLIPWLDSIIPGQISLLRFGSPCSNTTQSFLQLLLTDEHTNLCAAPSRIHVIPEVCICSQSVNSVHISRTFQSTLHLSTTSRVGPVAKLCPREAFLVSLSCHQSYSCKLRSTLPCQTSISP